MSSTVEAVHFTPEDLTAKFNLPSKARMYAIAAMIAGILFVGLGFLFPSDSHAHHEGTHEEHQDGQHHSKVEANNIVHYVSDTEQEHAATHHHHEITQMMKVKSAFITASWYMLTLALGAMFFIAIHRAGNAGWHVAVTRIAEAQSLWLVFGLVTFFIVWLVGGDIYEWRILKPGEDALIDSKRAFLNESGQLVRLFLFIGVWAGVAFYTRRLSKQQDTSSNPLREHKKLTRTLGLYIFFFAVSFTLFCFDWIKSLEPHWFSTVFGINAFAGSMVSALSVMTLIIYFLKSQGLLKFVNDAHMHDIGKYMFGFSIFWTYTWLSQYLLIWYANIPEENIYYVKRYLVGDPQYLGYRFFFFFNIFINFLFPFFVLMMRNNKRTPKIMIPVAIVLLFGHWNDLFLMTAPGSVGTEFASLGYFFPALGMMLLLGGAFMLVVLTNLTKANLIPQQHPYKEESLNHSTGVV